MARYDKKLVDNSLDIYNFNINLYKTTGEEHYKSKAENEFVVIENHLEGTGIISKQDKKYIKVETA